MFSITSPRLLHVESAMTKVNIGLVVRDSALTVAERLVAPMQAAARAGDASPQLVGDIRVHDGHLNTLVMRDRASYGDVIVGIDGRSKAADEAEELEWGGLDTRPVGWVRTTAAKHRVEVNRMWSNELTRELDRRVR